MTHLALGPNASNSPFDQVDHAIEDVRRGRLVIVAMTRIGRTRATSSAPLTR